MPLYPNLFLPLKLGSHYLKNRLVMAPIVTGLEQADQMSRQLVSFYRDRAVDNGVGMVILGNGIVHATGTHRFSDPVLSAEWFERARTLTNTLHDCDTKVILQLIHEGASAEHPLRCSASAITNRDTGKRTHRMPSCLIEYLIHVYSLQAYGAVNSGGFDGIEVYAGRLSLPNSFVSPALNKRNDRWGIQGRSDFCIELAKKIRNFIGSKPILVFRLSLIDVDPNGNNWNDILALAQTLVNEGVNAFSFEIALSPNDLPVDTDLTPDAVWTEFMEKFSASVGVPVIFGKKQRSPTSINALISRHINAMVEIGRPLIADKDWSRKIKDGRPIMPCIDCSKGCFGWAEHTRTLSCPANPYLFTPPIRLQRKNNVLVIGGGPAGMAAAREAALRGMSVTLVEEKDELGGMLRLAGRIPGRQRILELLKQQEQELTELGVTIIKKTRANGQWIETHFRRHKIIVAVGRESVIPDIPGIDSTNVVTFEDLLSEKESVGHRVAVIGHDHLATDITRLLSCPQPTTTTDWFCAWGVGDPAKHAGGMRGVIPHVMPPPQKTYLISDASYSPRDRTSPLGARHVLQWLRMNGVNIFEHAVIEQIDNYSVRVNPDGEENPVILRVDHIVIAGALEPREELIDELHELDIPFTLAGSIASREKACSASEAAEHAQGIIRNF